jgi:hypothetical protein
VLKEGDVVPFPEERWLMWLRSTIKSLVVVEIQMLRHREVPLAAFPLTTRLDSRINAEFVHPRREVAMHK